MLQSNVMVNPELLDYIRKQSAIGTTREKITTALTGQGWTLVDIDEAFTQLAPPPAPALPTEAPPLPAPLVVVEEPHIDFQSTIRPPVFRPSLSSGVRWAIVIGLVVVLIGGGTGYAYTQKIGPFAHIPYTEDNLISGILSSSSKILSSSYSATAQLAVGPRDSGAEPFTIQVSNEAQLSERYGNDYTRVQDISALLQILITLQKSGYPATLEQVVAISKGSYSSWNKKPSLTDPVSRQKYAYTLTDGGKDFALKVTFETDNAISQIRKSYNSSTTPSISDKTVTFTKESPSYLYISREIPKPFLVQLGESMRLLPAEISVGLGFSATTDWSQADSASWKWNVDASGDFGDLTYKINIDALKKDTNYYFRVNNIPSLFGGGLSSVKGQWVKIGTSSASTTGTSYGNELSYIAKELPEIEKNYKESRAQSVESLRKIAGFADETHLLSFKEAPHSEKIDRRLLYRYNLEINKDAILSFYRKVVAEATTNPKLRGLGLFDDPGLIEYLQSDEFSKVFDYYNKNTSVTLWVDPFGFPAQLEYTMRIVPPDTATQLSKKQINVTFKLALSNINNAPDISVPDDAKPIENFITAIDKNLNYLNGIQSYLATIQTHAELYYNDSNNSYGTQSWVSGSSSSCTRGMFKNSSITQALSSIRSANPSAKVACYAYDTGYMVGAELASGGWWCIDSSGQSKKEAGTILSTAPNSKLCP